MAEWTTLDPQSMRGLCFASQGEDQGEPRITGVPKDGITKNWRLSLWFPEKRSMTGIVRNAAVASQVQILHLLWPCEGHEGSAGTPHHCGVNERPLDHQMP